jgi:hypothetical protein
LWKIYKIDTERVYVGSQTPARNQVVMAVEEVVNSSNKVVPVVAGITKAEKEAKMDEVTEDSREVSESWSPDQRLS